MVKRTSRTFLLPISICFFFCFAGKSDQRTDHLRQHGANGRHEERYLPPSVMAASDYSNQNKVTQSKSSSNNSRLPVLVFRFIAHSLSRCYSPFATEFPPIPPFFDHFFSGIAPLGRRR